MHNNDRDSSRMSDHEPENNQSTPEIEGSNVDDIASLAESDPMAFLQALAARQHQGTESTSVNTEREHHATRFEAQKIISVDTTPVK